MPQIIIYITELIGTAAFAISGALIAVYRKLDLFGVIALGVVTALGGGVVRDVIIGITPPTMFVDYVYFLVAAAFSAAAFVFVSVLKKTYIEYRAKIERVINVFDAAGLGIFSAVGVTVAVGAGYADNVFLCVFVGMVTGCGGGIMRDMMSKATPMVFRKKIYAVASIAGSFICYFMIYVGAKSFAAILSGAVIVFAIRMLASRFGWNLPRARLD
jgi:uncharacterized membrane protein YeiH